MMREERRGKSVVVELVWRLSVPVGFGKVVVVGQAVRAGLKFRGR